MMRLGCYSGDGKGRVEKPLDLTYLSKESLAAEWRMVDEVKAGKQGGC